MKTYTLKYGYADLILDGICGISNVCTHKDIPGYFYWTFKIVYFSGGILEIRTTAIPDIPAVFHEQDRVTEARNALYDAWIAYLDEQEAKNVS